MATKTLSSLLNTFLVPILKLSNGEKKKKTAQRLRQTDIFSISWRSICVTVIKEHSKCLIFSITAALISGDLLFLHVLHVTFNIKKKDIVL